MKKRILSVLLCLVMCLSLMPMSALADDLPVLNANISGGILSWDTLEGAARYYWNIGKGEKSCGGNAETTSIDLNSKCESYGFSAGDYDVTLYARDSSNTRISEEWKGTFHYNSTQETLDAPTSLRVEDSICKWNAVTNATSYIVAFQDADGRSYGSATVNDSQYAIDPYNISLVDGQDYKFMVKASAAGYVDSEYSESDLFTYSKPSTTVTLQNVTISGGILSWDALEGAASYYWNIGKGEKSCGGNAETTSIDLNSKCESYDFAAGDYDVTLYARNSSNTRISEEWKGTFHYDPSVPITFKDLPEAGVTNITVPEGDYDTEVAVKDAFILFWNENIKTDGEFVLVDCFDVDENAYHMWIVSFENDVISAMHGGYSNLDTILYSINDPNPIYDWWINGTYTAIHTHAFTYTANNGKITATCVDGCDDGYDTNPLTLTLTAPASLVYNRNAKAFTFADGEAAAWTGAGLELPIITYAAKSGSSLTSDKAVDAGSYTASVTVDTDKTASLDFEITKATPYIKTPPAPNEIEYGQKLADSTLVDGYVHISSTDSPEVAGLFEWTNPDTVPGIDDSEVTLYDVTFTPVDTNNYNTASCQVKITVNHTHNPKLVNGQAPQKGIAGWKDYFECICGERYEDASGSILIPDLAVWKAEGGNGYLAPLTPTKYTVTFNMGNHGTQIDPQTVEEGNMATKPSDPTAEGWTFGGWYVDTDFSAMFDFNTAINANTTIFAKWTENPGPQPVVYTIIVGAGSEWTKGETEGLLITSDAPFAKFSSVKVDESTIAATNYAAEEGSTKITLAPAYLETLSVGTHSIEIVSNDGSASTNFTIKAAVPPVPTSYTVTFNMNGHGTQITAQTVESGSKVIKPADPTASGYTFDGWYADAAFSAKFDFNTAITENTTVYAKWTENPPIPTTYTVTFNMNGHGTQVADQTVEDGNKATKPADPTAEGWTFDGWYADATFSVAFDFNTAITADTTVYAKWTKNSVTPPVPTTYTVSFNMNGHGTQVADQTVEDGSKATKPTDPTAEGWTFGGWYADATFSVTFNFDTAINANTTIYAKWTENTDPQPHAYTIVAGANSEWTEGGTAGLLITSDAPFAKFSSVKIDGSTIAASNYIAEEGSTKITLAPAYLETLSVGTHSIEIVSNDGSVSTNFTVKAAASTDPTSPQTGDNSHMFLWIALLFISGGVLVGTTVYGRKKKYNAD